MQIQRRSTPTSLDGSSEECEPAAHTLRSSPGGGNPIAHTHQPEPGRGSEPWIRRWDAAAVLVPTRNLPLPTEDADLPAPIGALEVSRPIELLERNSIGIR